MSDFFVEYVLPIFILIVILFTTFLMGIFVKNYFIENTNNNCVCEEVSDQYGIKRRYVCQD